MLAKDLAPGTLVGNARVARKTFVTINGQRHVRVIFTDGTSGEWPATAVVTGAPVRREVAAAARPAVIRLGAGRSSRRKALAQPPRGGGRMSHIERLVAVAGAWDR